MTRNLSFEVGDKPRLEIRVQSGRIDVETGPVGGISLAISGRVNEDEVLVDQVGDTVTVRQTGTLVFGRGGSVRIQAVVPELTDLELSGASTDMWLYGRLGDASLRTASGDVSAEILGRLAAKTASGDLRVDRVEGDVDVTSASGDVSVDHADGRLSASLASGDLRSQRIGDDLRVNTASGDIRVERCEGVDINVKSVSGEIAIGIPQGSRVDADINTLSGRIRLPDEARDTLRADPPAGDDGPRRRVRLVLRSVSGNIDIHRS